MANVFDQFDAQQEANVFDQFDDQPTDYNPAEGMSNYELAAAGAGKAVVDLGRGAQQSQALAAQGLQSVAEGDALGDFKIPGTDIPIGPGLIKYAPSVQIANFIAGKLGINDKAYIEKLQAGIDEAKQRDAPLMDTGAGKAGYVGGAVLAGAPVAMMPGANTIPGAAIAGALTGAAQPVASDEGDIVEQKVKNAAIGGAISGGVQAAGQAINNAFRGMRVRDAARQAGRQAANAERDATLAASQAEGYIVPPAMTEGNTTGKLLSGLSGKAKTEQFFRVRNQQVTDRLARRALNLPDDVPITPDVTRAVREAAVQVGYDPVRAVGSIPIDNQYTNALNRITRDYAGSVGSFPNAARTDVAQLVDDYRVQNFTADDAITEIRAIRERASDAFRTGNSNLGRAMRDLSAALEDQIERHLQTSGRNGQEMLRNYRDARRMIARSFTVDDAIVEGSGSVDATAFARALKRGAPLDNELETIGRFANNYREVARVPGGGDRNPLSVLDYATGAFGAGASAATPYGMLALGLPAARVGARYAVASPLGQRLFTSPSYTPNMLLRTGEALTGQPTNTLLRAGAPALVYSSQQ